MPAAVALSQPISKAVYDYWNALRNGRPVPRRSDVDPAHLRAVLAHVLLLDRLSPDQTVFRLAGTAVCQAFGRELRDHSFLSLWDATHRGLIASALSVTHAKAAPILLRCRGHALGQPAQRGEWLMLPLVDDGGQAVKLLASFAFEQQGFSHKAFTRLELLRAETIAPSRDRVELTLAAPSPLRAPLSLVSAAPAPAGAALPHSSMSRPWAGLLHELLRRDEA